MELREIEDSKLMYDESNSAHQFSKKEYINLSWFRGEIGCLSKLFAGAFAGGIGLIAGNPFDILNTRMMA